MSLIDALKEFDKRYDEVNEMWATEIADLYNSSKIDPKSAKFEKLAQKINKKYADIASDILVARDEVYQQLVKEQNEEYFAEFSDPNREVPTAIVDENGRPVGKKWVDGHWVDIETKK